MIERLMRTVNGKELAEWMRDIKRTLPELSTFIDFVAATWLRFEEAIQAWNLIIDLSEREG